VDPLAALAAEPARAALLLDLDGVLAPIVERPEDARVPPETQAELARLGLASGVHACNTVRPSEIAR
jgi:trehalose 6-phosphate phosphatase